MSLQALGDVFLNKYNQNLASTSYLDPLKNLPAANTQNANCPVLDPRQGEQTFRVILKNPDDESITKNVDIYFKVHLKPFKATNSYRLRVIAWNGDAEIHARGHSLDECIVKMYKKVFNLKDTVETITV
jgi:hypothetical protein